MLTAFDAIARLVISPAYIRCAKDLPSVCRRMERLTLSRSTQFERTNAALYRRKERATQAAYTLEARANALRQGREYAFQAALAALKADESKRAEIQASLGAGEQWAQMETVVKFQGAQTVFPQVDAIAHEKLGILIDPKHESKASRFQFNEVYCVSKARLFAPACEPQEPLEHTPKDICKACKAKRLADKEGRALSEKEAREPHNCYSDKGKKSRKPNGAATCEPLFCADLKGSRGYEKTIGFSRTIALRYLQKRMIFARKSNAKSVKTDESRAAIIPASLKARKAGSSKHLTAFYVASDIEDIIQEAFLIFAGITVGKQGEPLITLEGNLLNDTCNATRRAYTLFMRAAYKERKRLDILAARLKAREDKARGYANRYYDSEIEALIDAIREHGASNQKELAQALDISAGELSKRLSRLRDRKALEESRESRKARERITDVYAAHGIPVKASIQELFRAGA